jgi:sugar (pentulose or hexulose) kinase
MFSTAIRRAVADLGAAAKRTDIIGLSVMSPAWVAMDRAGNPVTPIVTHQDRRSIEIAREIERRVGKTHHLRIAGNRPFPGSISSTTVGVVRAVSSGLACGESSWSGTSIRSSIAR